jgi:hypothetical protein
MTTQFHESCHNHKVERDRYKENYVTLATQNAGVRGIWIHGPIKEWTAD